MEASFTDIDISTDFDQTNTKCPNLLLPLTTDRHTITEPFTIRLRCRLPFVSLPWPQKYILRMQNIFSAKALIPQCAKLCLCKNINSTMCKIKPLQKHEFLSVQNIAFEKYHFFQ